MNSLELMYAIESYELNDIRKVTVIKITWLALKSILDAWAYPEWDVSNMEVWKRGTMWGRRYEVVDGLGESAIFEGEEI